MSDRIRRTPASRRGLATVLGGVLALTGILVLEPSAGAASGGTLLWSRRYDGPASSDDAADSISVSPDGTQVFITGGSTNDSVDYATVAYDAPTGTTLWARRYDGPVGGRDFAVDLAVSPDGSSVFVTGYSEAKGGAGWATIAYEASSGATLWSRRHHGTATALAVSPDGSKVLVVGTAPTTTDMPDYATVAYNAETGATIWDRRYDGDGQGDFASAVVVGGGTVFVTGTSEVSDATGGDYATVAYGETNGSKLWVRRYDGPAHGVDLANAMVGSIDGSRVFVTGQSEGRDGTADFASVAYDGSTGERLWTRRYGTHQFSGALAADATGDGSAVFVTGGVTTAASSHDFGTIAYDGATGARLWAHRYTGPDLGMDTPWSIALNPGATRAYVTGVSDRGPTGVDVAILAYDASTGSTVWSRFVTSADAQTDVGNTVDVSPDGSEVFVGGSWDSSASDYLTLAYSG
jgi:hypothetical protein